MHLAAVLASIALYAPLPAGVTVHLERCPTTGTSGCAYVQTGDIYVTPHPDSDRRVFRFLLAHELGHVWDAQHMDDSHRDSFAAQVGMLGQPWLDPDALAQPGESFADAYAFCAFSPRARRGYLGDFGGYTYGTGIAKQVVANVCWLLDHPPA